uniref:Kelch like family member 17 n=1 Tax=Monodelphis domestica TaxID=13616 RepID=A0A5F8H0Q1_MONDO
RSDCLPQMGISMLWAAMTAPPIWLLWKNTNPRSTHDLVAMDGWLYAVGGNDGSSSLNSIEKYNPRTNKWVAASCMFTRRSSVGVAILELLNFPPPSSPTLSVSSTFIRPGQLRDPEETLLPSGPVGLLQMP